MTEGKEGVGDLHRFEAVNVARDLAEEMGQRGRAWLDVEPDKVKQQHREAGGSEVGRVAQPLLDDLPRVGVGGELLLLERVEHLRELLGGEHRDLPQQIFALSDGEGRRRRCFGARGIGGGVRSR